MYINMKVLNKVLISLGVICLSVAVYLACGLHMDAFKEAVPLLIAPTFVAVFTSIYSPPVKTRTAVIASALLSLAAVGVIVGAVLTYLPA